GGNKLDEISEAIGGLRAAVRELIRRADRSDETGESRHRENQSALGDMRQGMQVAISDLRDASNRRYEETAHAIAELTLEVKSQGDKLEEHARGIGTRPDLAALSIGRGKLMLLAGLGMVTLTLLGWALQFSFQWLIQQLLK